MNKIIFNFKISFLIMIFVFPSSVFSSDKLLPLSQLVLQEQSLSRHLYVNERCAGLNQSIAGRFSGSSNEKAQKLSGALFLRGANHSMYAINFANKMGKNYTQQDALSRALLFAKIYKKEMDRIYDMTGSAIGGIILDDQTICDKIHKDGGSILLSNLNKNKKIGKVKIDQFGILETIKVERDIFKYDEKLNACSVGRIQRHNSKLTSNYSLTIGNEGINLIPLLTGIFYSENKIIGYAKSISGRSLDNWKSVPKQQGVFILSGKKGTVAVQKIFEDQERFFGTVIKYKDKVVDEEFGKIIPYMTFETSNKTFKVGFTSQRWSKFSKCVSNLIKSIMKK